LLRSELKRSLSLCSAGAMLSHNARIEASYGGTMLKDMQQIANQIEFVLYNAINEMKQLNLIMQDFDVTHSTGRQ